jgi:hypothetical protein
VSGGLDALDLSARTLTTVGTTAHADGEFRLLVDTEPLLGLLVAGIAFARLINALPQIGDIATNYPTWRAAVAENEAAEPPTQCPRHDEDVCG